MSHLEENSEHNKIPRHNLVGQKFNQLTVLSFSHFAKEQYPHWLCQCDCGETKVVDQYKLVKGTTKSCGCLKAQRGKTLRATTVTIHEGVAIEKTAAKTLQSNNTTGFRGVYRVENKDKWRASIIFQGVSRHLGYFNCFEDAVKARLGGEEIVDAFIANYYNEVAPTEAKAAFENQIHAKAKAEAEFKRVICKNKAFSTVSAGTIFSGDIATGEHLLIGGAVTGTIQCTKRVLVNGTVHGNITAEAVYLPNGKVIGDITAKRIFCSNVHEQILGKVTGSISPYTHIESADIEGGFQL